MVYKARLDATLETGHQYDNRQNLMVSTDYIHNNGVLEYIVDEY